MEGSGREVPEYGKRVCHEAADRDLASARFQIDRTNLDCRILFTFMGNPITLNRSLDQIIRLLQTKGFHLIINT
jgi:hypothetical protein